MKQVKDLLLEGERLDDLQYRGLRIIQDPRQYCFSADSILLSHYIQAGPRDRAAELCAGGGVIALLTGARCGTSFVCVEKNPLLCDMARRTFLWNGVDIPVYQADIRSAPGLLGSGVFSVVVCNPPYYKDGTQSPDAFRSMARAGAGCSIEEVAAAAAGLLRNGGKFFLCFPAFRLAELMEVLRGSSLEPKRMRLVAAMPSKGPYLVLIEAQKNRRPGLIMEPVLYLRDGSGQETPEIRRMYHGDE